MHKILASVWAVCAFFALGTGAEQAVAAPAGGDRQVAVAAIPAKAYATLKKIDAGTWPQSGAPGTRGGTVWQNREGRLPAEDDQGRRIVYREWDVNDKIQGRNRDAERIITGSDHSAWYTGDHYRTFERMR
ncbi:guanine-specific ribonuclease N1 and T1 [Segniliparus rotundus DSM 44985]|uniref:Guanine-specific ribonuclease N1 and T1 n=1 Tax=Segniliparus rotundus (strain ATCC BAA-972 / CDC 1076 / CIP 108378 / DSM 44985 / JCM 13578) TaxID=640132 RepID=D6ZA08_SEGRD|nr:guanine-specific ribonuclease N1 and T1 [Segniliparus rotundus DSM 44985]